MRWHVSLTPSEWAAWGALGLSVWLAAARMVGRARASRRAWPVAWLEKRGDATYCVVLNCGPADAREVMVAFTGADGSAADLVASDRWPMPLSRLAPGDVIYLPYMHIPGANSLVLTVTLTWKDKRWKGQRVERATSLRPTGDTYRVTPGQMREQAFRAGF